MHGAHSPPARNRSNLIVTIIDGNYYRTVTKTNAHGKRLLTVGDFSSEGQDVPVSSRDAIFS
jgi:hypothetical protein